jgi:predicted permease
MLSVEVLFALFGLMVLARVGYVAQFLRGAGASAGSYALVCPGVALSVLTQFWLNKGLVAAGLVAKFGVAYWAISGVAVALQLGMIALVWVLARKHFAAPREGVAATA